MPVLSKCNCTLCQKILKIYDTIKEHVYDGTPEKIEELYIVLGSLMGVYIAEFFHKDDYKMLVESTKDSLNNYLQSLHQD